MNIDNLLKRDSFIERGARSRAQALLDPGTFRELAGPFERLHSPWLAMQKLVTQADDGVVVAKGHLAGQPTVVLAIEGAFQGGSMGEIGGAKIAGALELAVRDNERGVPTQAVILFETGGVRLQEANLGLAAIAEIQSAIVALRRHRPVVGLGDEVLHGEPRRVQACERPGQFAERARVEQRLRAAAGTPFDEAVALQQVLDAHGVPPLFAACS
jgi:malonate decarboxylase beta subunit